MEKIIRRLLKRHDIALSKRLGQHLLLDQGVLERVARAMATDDQWYVVEVGAGAGNLTALLAQGGAHVHAIELDERFRSLHESVFAEWDELAPRVTFSYGDALSFDFAAAAREASTLGKKFAIVGNIPYQITTALVSKVVYDDVPFDSMTLLMQREVGERLAARYGGRQSGAISVKVNFFCDVQKLFDVPRRAFLPPPQVESQLVTFRRHVPPLPPDERARFFALVDAAFAQRRKMLSNAVAAKGIGYTKSDVESALSELGLPPTARAEEIGLDEFLSLYAKLNSR